MNTLKLEKKYFIKISKTIEVVYCKRRHMLTFVGPLKTKSLQVENKIILIEDQNLLGVTHFSNDNFKKSVKTSKQIQGTIIAKIKAILIEITYNLYSKLNFVGVGYRAFSVDNLENQFYFKLGYSHLVYFKVPKPLDSFCIKFTKLFIFGNVSTNTITQVSADIRQCKKPEPYKGKGILYDGEVIKLKKGKKI